MNFTAIYLIYEISQRVAHFASTWNLPIYPHTSAGNGLKTWHLTTFFLLLWIQKPLFNFNCVDLIWDLFRYVWSFEDKETIALVLHIDAKKLEGSQLLHNLLSSRLALELPSFSLECGNFHFVWSKFYVFTILAYLNTILKIPCHIFMNFCKTDFKHF